MLVQCDGTLEVLQTELADVDFGQLGVVKGIGGGVPRVHLIATKLHHLKTILLAVWNVALVCVCVCNVGGCALWRCVQCGGCALWRCVQCGGVCIVEVCAMWRCVHCGGVCNVEV